jgi:hypothetical protein
MMTAIDLDDKPLLDTCKVCYVVTYRMLPPKLRAFELSAG